MKAHKQYLKTAFVPGGFTVPTVFLLQSLLCPHILSRTVIKSE